MKSHPVTLESIVDANRRLQRAVVRTPCVESEALSNLTGSRIFLKREDLQATGSFKERGACNALLLLPTGAATHGVIAASAGNHAQGLAFHGRRLGIQVHVVMPNGAPAVKIDSCRRFGAKVILHGDSFEEAERHAHTTAEALGLAFIHPFDSPTVIAGQGTVGLEFLSQLPDLDAVVVPAGGGGLLAGVATAVRSLRPEVQIFGVEPSQAPSLSTALRLGRSAAVEARPTLADGLAVRQVGQLGLEAAARLVDAVVTVSERALAASVSSLSHLDGITAEGAGAAALAALMEGELPGLRGKTVLIPVTGRNIDSETHRAVLKENTKTEKPEAPELSKL